MNGEKSCPLDKIGFPCIKGCAWNVNGECAVVVIAKSLHNLKETWGKAGEE